MGFLSPSVLCSYVEMHLYLRLVQLAGPKDVLYYSSQHPPACQAGRDDRCHSPAPLGGTSLQQTMEIYFLAPAACGPFNWNGMKGKLAPSRCNADELSYSTS